MARYCTNTLAKQIDRWAARNYAAFRYAPWTFGTEVALAVRPWS